MSFKIGDEITCINDSPGLWSGKKQLKVGEDYLVIEINEDGNLGLYGMPIGYWLPSRFIKKQDNFGSKIAEKIEKEINTKKLVEHE